MTLYLDAQERLARRPRSLGSSARHRRLVVGGYVLFDPIALARPSMRPSEIELLTSLLISSKRILEYGAGGSTMLAIKLGVQNIVSVESDLSWIQRIRQDEAAKRAEADGRLKLLHANIGPIGLFGGPKGPASPEMHAHYAHAPWTLAEADLLDLVVVDGRFRVACILEAVLRVKQRSVIAIHDFWNRRAYHVVLPFLEEVARSETLGVFRVAEKIDASEVLSVLSAHMASHR